MRFEKSFCVLTREQLDELLDKARTGEEIVYGEIPQLVVRAENESISYSLPNMVSNRGIMEPVWTEEDFY